MVRIEYRLSSVGQKANLVAGGDGKSIQRITVKHGEPWYPEAVALATEYSSSQGNYWEVDCSTRTHRSRGGALRELIYDTTPTVERLLADQRARVEEFEKKYREEEAKEAAEAEAGVLELMGKTIEECLYRDNYGRWNRVAGWWSEPRLEAKGEAALLEMQRRNNQEDAEKQVAKEKSELDRKMKMRLWIDERGSPRLRNCIKENIKCDGAYYSERLAAEYPNWVRYDKIDGKCSDPINPPDEAFAMLEEARKDIPEATLEYYVNHGIKLYCAFAKWPAHPEHDLVYFGDQDYESQPDNDDEN